MSSLFKFHICLSRNTLFWSMVVIVAVCLLHRSWNRSSLENQLPIMKWYPKFSTWSITYGPTFKPYGLFLEKMNGLPFTRGIPQCPLIGRSRKLSAHPISLHSERSIHLCCKKKFSRILYNYLPDTCPKSKVCCSKEIVRRYFDGGKLAAKRWNCTQLASILKLCLLEVGVYTRLFHSLTKISVVLVCLFWYSTCKVHKFIFLSPKMILSSCMNLVLWPEVLIPRRNLQRMRLLSIVKLPDGVRACTIQRLVLPVDISVQEQ
jgi:hypothetical protein